MNFCPLMREKTNQGSEVDDSAGFLQPAKEGRPLLMALPQRERLGQHALLNIKATVLHISTHLPPYWLAKCQYKHFPRGFAALDCQITILYQQLGVSDLYKSTLKCNLAYSYWSLEMRFFLTILLLYPPKNHKFLLVTPSYLSRSVFFFFF